LLGPNTTSRKRVQKMAEHDKRFVWVKDEEGNEYVCRKTDFEDRKVISESDLTACLENASRAVIAED
jgi:hypothetical protein